VLKKNRLLEQQLAKIKVELSQKSLEVTKCVDELTETKKSLEQHKQLINRLEEDLSSKVNELENWTKTSLLTQPLFSSPTKELSLTFPTSSAQTQTQTHSHNINTNANTSGEIVQEIPNRSESFFLTTEAEPHSLVSSPTKSFRSLTSPHLNTSTNPSQSLLHIVCGQRDRLRQRLEDVEKEKISLQESLRQSLRQLEEVKADNLKLYEKLQYVISFKQKEQEEEIDENSTPSLASQTGTNALNNNSNSSSLTSLASNEESNNFTKKKS